MPLTDYIVCESVAAIVTHIRRIADTAPNYGGHVNRPLALCGSDVAWDNKIPVMSATCKKCLKLLCLQDRVF